jgi:hypothetical protein
MARQQIPDSQCGFRFIRKEVLESVPLRSTRFEIESELLLRATARRWKVISVPIKSIYQEHASYIRPVRDALRFIMLVMRCLVWR